MRFLYEEPLWFWRDCHECQTFLLDGRNRIQREKRSGRAIRNPNPPRCARSPCTRADPETGALERRPRFTPEDSASYMRWRMCRAFKALPRAGGLEDQNPWDMARFEALERAEQADESRRQSEERAALLGAKLRRMR